MEHHKKTFKELSLSKRIQLIVAIGTTGALLAVFPVYAWFAHQRSIAELQQIREPDLLYITAANADDVKFFDLSSIKVKDDNNQAITTPEYYPFGVAGKYVPTFTLQLAHTTNNPFHYKIYNGTAYTTRDAAETAGGEGCVVLEYKLHGEWTVLEENDVVFDVQLPASKKPIAKTESQTTIYVLKGSEISEVGGKALNMSDEDSYHASAKYHEECYEGYEELTKFAEPVYHQYTNIPSGADPGDSFMKTFVLEISWTAEDVTNNKIDNDKETDIVYLAAFRR